MMQAPTTLIHDHRQRPLFALLHRVSPWIDDSVAKDISVVAVDFVASRIGYIYRSVFLWRQRQLNNFALQHHSQLQNVTETLEVALFTLLPILNPLVTISRILSSLGLFSHTLHSSTANRRQNACGSEEERWPLRPLGRKEEPELGRSREGSKPI
jgi:hypothetical protein